QKFGALDRRTTPVTSYPFSSRSSARYEPSWPVMPVMSARLAIQVRDEGLNPQFYAAGAPLTLPGPGVPPASGATRRTTAASEIPLPPASPDSARKTSDGPPAAAPGPSSSAPAAGQGQEWRPL